jgi:hypothetical protein
VRVLDGFHAPHEPRGESASLIEPAWLRPHHSMSLQRDAGMNGKPDYRPCRTEQTLGPGAGTQASTTTKDTTMTT